jgi:hypothetical protein
MDFGVKGSEVKKNIDLIGKTVSDKYLNNSRAFTFKLDR